MKIILDTNFLLTTAKQKIDFDRFANEIFDKKIEWLIPEEVLRELEEISVSERKKGKDKDAAKLALKLIEGIPHKKVSLPVKNVDEGILRYAKRNNLIIATMDRGIKQRFNGKVLTVRGKKELLIQKPL